MGMLHSIHLLQSIGSAAAAAATAAQQQLHWALISN
jgi:hypothetical protein